MDLAHVRTLQEIVKHGGFSRAARVLHRSQPAVSHHIRLLEAELGVSLVERVGKRAFPTAAGHIFLTHAARALQELDMARQAVQQVRGRVAGRVRLGTGATAATYLLPSVLGPLRRRYPDLELAITTGNSPDIVASVGDNVLDLGLVTLPASGRHLAVFPFAVDALVGIAPPTPEWVRRRSLDPEELGRHPMICYERGGTIRAVIDEWFRRAGVIPRIAMELGNAEAIKRLVEAGLGVGVTSAITVKSEVRLGSLIALPLAPRLARRLAIVSRRDKPVSPALQALVGALETFRLRAARMLAPARAR
ncbi:MAG TPA: LysR substrate-binding domain-containing protein [Methylomirabilota bacterium]|jgi:DNA-binding transcriptional LysR family regulator|nr:LysR substrate-binding domain-containing protein [Methylomirabilota bacterium]